MHRTAKGSWKIMALTGGMLLASLSACSRPASWRVSEWKAGDGTSRSIPEKTVSQSQVQFDNANIEFSTQSVAGVPVENSFVKSVSKDGEVVWQQSHALEAAGLPREESVEREVARQEKVAARLDKYARKLGCRESGVTAPALRWYSGWRVVFKRPCELPTGEVSELVASSRGRLISQDAVGGQLAGDKEPVAAPSVNEGPSSSASINVPMVNESATLYPIGPKFSQLKTMTLKVSPTPGFLFNSQLQVVSDGGFQFATLDELPLVKPTEDRFDMLQAYYYSTAALDWVDEHLKFKASHLKMRTQVGYPARSNIAFYYGREIRIGSGDDISYSKMALDPSIVIHETMHGVVEPLTMLPFQGEGGSLHEGLADALTALQTDNPNMGESAYLVAPYQRTIKNELKLSDRNGGLYHDSTILSGFLWEVKEVAGFTTAIDLTKHLLTHLSPISGFTHIQTQISDWLNTTTNPNKSKVETIAIKRGWL